MFESLVANLLNRVLGSYLENFDTNQLNIGIWSGDVKLRNLRLKKESLDKFKLPVDVKFGHLGELTLQIPWSNLKGKPVRIIIQDVYLLASPIVMQDFDLEEEEKRSQAVKQEKLSQLEAFLEAKSQELGEDLENESFVESLVTKIIDNLQVTIKNIHIRYEDDSILTESPYSIGFSLDELSAVSTDEDWVPSFINITQSLTRKLVTLSNLSCYMDTQNSKLYSHLNREEILSAFQSTMSDIEYLLKPVTGNGKLTVNKLGTTEKTPHIESDLFFEEFGVELNSQQYQDLLWTASKFHWIMKTEKFRKFRPKLPPSEAPKEWFKYAAESVLNEIHERNYKWSWAYFEKRRDQRKAYIKLWKLKLQGKITPEEQKELDDLEWDLPFEDIKLYRSFTRNELKKDKQHYSLYHSETKPAQTTNTSGGWFSGWWGAGNNTTTTTNKEDDASSHEECDDTDEKKLDLSLTDEQRKALYDAIDYDGSTATEVDIPAEWVKMKITARLDKGGLTIKRDKTTNLAEVVFEGCKTDFLERPNSFLAKFQMDEFRVEDGSGTSIYKHVVSVKQNSDIQTSHESFLQLAFENNPLDQSADSNLFAKLKSMTIYYNPKFIEEIVKFFTPPKIHLDTVGAIMNAAESTVEGLTAQTRIGLEYALEEHKTINVRLDLQAPLVILPLDPSSVKSPVAILDAGHISVMSDLVDKSKVKEYKEKDQYSKEDWKSLRTLMYDKFHVNLQDARFLVGHNIKTTMEQLYSDGKDRSAYMLDTFNLGLLLEVSILPDAQNLAQIRVGGNVPKIALSINDFQYKTLMQIIDAAIPNTDFDTSDDSSIFKAFGNHRGAGDIDMDEGNKQALTEKKKPVNNEQHQFEFNFSVDLVQISLSRCIDGVTLQSEPLADIIGESFNLNFYKTLTDMFLTLKVFDISLLDHIEKSGVPEFQKLISSNSDNETKNLLELNYNRKQRIVMFNKKEIEVFDQDVDMQIAVVKFVVTRKSYLSLLNFVLNTFTDPNAAPTPADELKHNAEDDEEAAPQKINVKVGLESIIMVLNEDGIKLATLQLSSAEIKVLLLPESMDVQGKLGAFTLHDEVNVGCPRDSPMRNLIKIDGDNLATFSYKTFDVVTESKPTVVQFETGAMTINFIESSFNRILSYLSQFLRMKAIYDSAREAAINQAAQLPAKLLFNLLIHAPTIVFPFEGSDNKRLVANLGEIYAHNEYKDVINAIEFGIRKVSLLSHIQFEEEDVVQDSHMVDELDIGFNIDYCEDYVKGTPTFTIDGKMPELDMHLTEIQLRMLTQLSESISQAFTFDDVDSNMEDVEEDAAYANEVLKHNTKMIQGDAPTGEQIATSKNEETSQSTEIPPDHQMVDLKFNVPRVALTIYNRTEGVCHLETCPLSLFAMTGLVCKFDMTQDTHFKSNVKVKSFVVEDVRKNTDSKFPVIIPAADDVDNQFDVSISTSGPAENKNTTVMLTVEKPKTILALDYLFELQFFVNKATEPDSQIETIGSIPRQKSRTSVVSNSANAPSSPANAENTNVHEPSKLGFSINIIEPSVILLADDSKENTEAVVFRVGQILITQQNVISLAANNIGMYLMLMNEAENSRYRIIDDFSISFAHDSRGSTATDFLTNIQASIDPLIIRVSLRDIRLALAIFNRANQLYIKHQGLTQSADDSNDEYKFSKDFKKKLTQYAPSIVSAFSEEMEPVPRPEIPEGVVIVKGEELTASFGGLRFVLIGEVSELPILDLNVKPFEAHAINWSTDLSAEVHIEQFINIFNYARSAWEPLVEPWPIAVYASKTRHPKEQLLVEVISRQSAQITLTSKAIALLSQVSNLITSDEKLKPRGEDYPYIIVNETGYDVEVWSDVQNSNKKAEIKSWESIPWSFEDWRKIRENLDADDASSLGIKFLNTDYQDIDKITASSVGEELYVMYPPVDGIHNRLSVDIVLREDNVKVIKLRSTVVIENDADIPIVVGLGDDKELVIESKQAKSIPIDVVYSGRLRIKPNIHTPYGWSEEQLYWKDALKNSSSLKCPAENPGDKSIYYFQAEAVFDKDEALAKVYPHMSIVVSAPLEIENLLPFDFTYRLYDKKAKKDWTGSVRKGVKSYVHVVSLDNLLLLSVQPVNCTLQRSEFAIINHPKKSEFEREHTLTLQDANGRFLKLRIYYPRKQSDSTSLKVVVYSPYVILNRTNLNLIVNHHNNQVESYGGGSSNNSSDSERKITPIMFSFDKHGDTKNRATIKAEDTVWSQPMSFDALGQSNELKLQVLGKQREIDIGVSITEGEGKYNLTKVVSIAPRYIFMNKLEEELQLVEVGTTNPLNIKPGTSLPLYGLRCLEKKSIMVKFLSGSGPMSWSQPFCINDVGQLFIKVLKKDIGQVLVKCTIMLEDATIFIHVENGNDQWPYSIRNFTDEEFYIYQNDPNINANGEIVKSETPYKPIYYKIPPKSVMPYAYDYPNAIIKEIIVRSHGRERAVSLAEIGNLKPFRLPHTQDREQAIVDLNVVADGPTQSLIITNYDPSTSLYKLKGDAITSSTSVANGGTQFEAVENDENYHTKIVTKFDGLGLSLINTNDQELCYITLKGLEFRYNESDLYQTVSAKLKWIQIDNQLYGGIFPLILYPTVIPKTGKELNSHPALSGSICKVKDDSHGVLFIKYATLLLQEMTIEIDEDFLFALLDFSKFPGASWNKEQVDRLCDDNLNIPEPVKLSDTSDVYFEALHLQPIQTNLSFVRTERVNAEDKIASQSTVMFFVNVLTMAIGNINDAPIKLNALFIENIRVPTPILVDSIQTHYRQAFFYQLHNIIGSADFLGNPVGLFNLLSSGVIDIFYEPYQGFVLNDRPQELGIGLAKGGLSFVKKSVFGFSDSFAKVTGSIAKGLSVATMDKEFQERRRLNTRRNRPKHALYGFATGANSFFDSISSGLTGVATAPIEGASTEGAAGFFKGLGKGIVGLPTKTAIGFFDLASNVSEGIRNTTTVFDGEGLDKVRLPRYINPNGIIKPYSQREAQGQYRRDGRIAFVQINHIV
ncbi:hypothetical protein G210_2649 [Candida maltosa Xu316]|uniref:Vacuolar protein sorting-associated protein n=1 Tax=Candida maltosa (strain Xu316) TaxID=1245528 RepID=M3JXD5_CANMX|nr:hypothetical protein G210_2649 [Candida maltosa Xu316]